MGVLLAVANYQRFRNGVSELCCQLVSSLRGHFAAHQYSPNRAGQHHPRLLNKVGESSSQCGRECFPLIAVVESRHLDRI